LGTKKEKSVMPNKEDNILWKKILFRAGTVVRFNKDWRMMSKSSPKRWIMTIGKGELAEVEKVNFNNTYYLRLREKRFSISSINLKEVDLSYLDIVTGKESVFFGECLDEELRFYRERQKMRSWVREKK